MADSEETRFLRPPRLHSAKCCRCRMQFLRRRLLRFQRRRQAWCDMLWFPLHRPCPQRRRLERMTDPHLRCERAGFQRSSLGRHQVKYLQV